MASAAHLSENGDSVDFDLLFIVAPIAYWSFVFLCPGFVMQYLLSCQPRVTVM